MIEKGVPSRIALSMNSFNLIGRTEDCESQIEQVREKETELLLAFRL